ncbi:hypothetical protein [Sphingomonas sp. UYP23]
MMDDAEHLDRPSATEQDLRMFIAEGGGIDTLIAGATPITATETSLSIAFTNDDGSVETIPLDVLLPLKDLKAPLAEVLALRTQEIERVSLEQDVTKLEKFVTFLAERRRTRIRLEEIDNALLQNFRDWLDEQRTPEIEGTRRSPYAARQKSGDQPLSVGTKSEYYRTAVSYLNRIRLQPQHGRRMQPDLDLNSEKAWKKRGRLDPTPVLTRPELKMLVRLCREEVVDTTMRLRAFWAICDGVATDDDRALVDEALAREVSAMREFFGADLPPNCKDELRVVRKDAANVTPAGEFRRRTFPLIWATNGPTYQEAVGLLYPTPARMLPFCMLFAIYFRYNAGVLGSLKASDLKRQPSVMGERLHGTPFKNRAKRKQHASWPINAEPHNPAEMLKTIERWTSEIKAHAPAPEENHLFLFRNHYGGVRSFASVGALRLQTGLFVRRHAVELDEKRFTPKSIRPSVIDLVHHLFDGDVVIASHAGNHRRVDTTIEHYLSDGARKRNDEGLAPVTESMQRWVETAGVIDPRNGGSATLAATPGWECEDIRSGAIAGEEPGVPCRAYGRCVSCELGKTRLDSPLAYALNFKLREAMLRARTTMPEHAWLARWSGELDLLERILALEFRDEAKAAANLDIPDLPTVE